MAREVHLGGSLPSLNIVEFGPESVKIASRTVEKRLKRFALAIKHDEAHHMHEFDRHGHWHH
jgi:hypothetical protein